MRKKIFAGVTRYKQANNYVLTRLRVIMAFYKCVEAMQSMMVI